MPNLLTGLHVTDVDLVRRGAVRDVEKQTEPQRFLIYKNESGHPDEWDAVDKAEMSTETRKNLPDSAFADPASRKFPHHQADGSLDLPHLRNALSRIGQFPDTPNADKIKSHLESHARAEGIGDRDEDTQKTESLLHKIRKATGIDNAGASDAVANALNMIEPYIEDLPDDVKELVDELGEAAGVESEASTQSPAETPNETPNSPATPATTQKEETMANENDDKNKAKTSDKPGEKTEAQKAEELRKAMDALPAPVREQVEALTKADKDKGERLAKAEAETALLKEQNQRTVFTAKAAELTTHLPDPDFVVKADGREDYSGWAALLKSISEKAPAEAKALEGVLKSANELMKENKLFSSVGKSGGSQNGNSATAAIEAKATELSKSEAGKGLTKEQAITKALEANPELYERYVSEQSKR